MNILPAPVPTPREKAQNYQPLPGTTCGEITWVDRTEGPYFISKKSSDLPASLWQNSHTTAYLWNQEGVLPWEVMLECHITPQCHLFASAPIEKCQSPIAPIKKPEQGQRSSFKDGVLWNRTNSPHTQAMFYMHPLLPSPNCNWENIPVGWLLPHSHSSS